MHRAAERVVRRGAALRHAGQRVDVRRDPRDELVGHGGGHHAPRRAYEQLLAELPFQAAQLRGDGRLGPAQTHGRRRQGAGSVDRDDGAQQLQVHRSSVP